MGRRYTFERVQGPAHHPGSRGTEESELAARQPRSDSWLAKDRREVNWAGASIALWMQAGARVRVDNCGSLGWR